MARKRFAPSHSFTGPHIYILADDTAWDIDRIDQEVAAIEAEHDYARPSDPVEWARTSPAVRGPSAHVVHRYWQGLTRFDLQAEGVRDYLDMNKDPEQWVLRPLSVRESIAIDAFRDAGKYTEATLFAFLAAVVGMSSPRGEDEVRLDKLLRARAEDKPVGGAVATDQQVLDAVGRIAYSIPEVVGQGVLMLSKDLSEDEKKRSAGPHGENSMGASPASAKTPSTAPVSA